MHLCSNNGEQKGFAVIIAAPTLRMDVTINSENEFRMFVWAAKIQMSFIVLKGDQKIRTKSLWHTHCARKVCLYSAGGNQRAAITFVSWHRNDSFGSPLSLWRLFTIFKCSAQDVRRAFDVWQSEDLRSFKREVIINKSFKFGNASFWMKKKKEPILFSRKKT